MLKSLIDDYLSDIFFRTLTNFVWFSIEIITINNLVELGALSSFLNVLSNLGYGYCASYLFYLINMHLPNLIQKRKAKRELAFHLLRIKSNINKVINDFNIANQDDLLPELMCAVTQNKLYETSMYFHADQFKILFGRFSHGHSFLSPTEINTIELRCKLLYDAGDLSTAPEATARNIVVNTLHTVEIILKIFGQVTASLDQKEKIRIGVILSNIPNLLRNSSVSNIFSNSKHISEIELAASLNEINKLIEETLVDYPPETLEQLAEAVNSIIVSSEELYQDSLKKFASSLHDIITENESPAAWYAPH